MHTLAQPAVTDISGIGALASLGVPAAGLVYSTGTVLAAATAGNGISINTGTISSSRAGLSMQVVRPFDGNAVMTNGTFLISPSLAYGIGNASLVVNPGTGTAIVSLLNNGTVVGSALTATGTLTSETIGAGVTLATGSSLNFVISGATSSPTGYVMITGVYTGT